MKNSSDLLWQPLPEMAEQSQMAQFLHWVNRHHQTAFNHYADLHAWSVAHPGKFWEAIWLFMEIVAKQGPQTIYTPASRMQDTQWFTGARLNFAENLLRYRDDHTAILFRSELKKTQRLTYAQLFHQVSALAQWLQQAGVKAGDRVAGWLPNCPETVVAMLAAASLGACWTACSSDFGLQGLLDRFGQINPKILFAADAHSYNGKIFGHFPELQALQAQLPSLQQIVLAPFSESPSTPKLPIPVAHWLDCVSQHTSAIHFTPLPFDHPLYILYSSGTTGKPKCMVHGAGGTLLQHLKELRLHTDLTRQDVIFFYTTCAWMMWHWLISSLAVGATIVLYEGNPFYPQKNTLFNLIDELGISVFGCGAKILEAAEKFGVKPRQSHSLTKLRTILTTGSPLLPESFDYVYRDIKPDICLSSISGGSDIISCFALGNPMLPVYRGELQCLGLGMDVQIFNEEGQPVHNTKGELVCATPFPSMPVYFWNDSDGEKYQHAYFDRFPHVWTHGDYAKLTEHGGLIIYGRSDATLNPGGVRIGTAEIYQQLEKFPEILEGLAVGQTCAGSERIILFIVLHEGKTLTSELIAAIKTTLRDNTSPHHVPAKIIAAPDLPRTLNGKLMEIAVKKIINGQPISHTETLANPQSLEFFNNLKLE